MNPDDQNPEKIDEQMLDAPNEPPEVVPAISAQQPGVGAAIGVEAFGNRADESVDEVMDNDEESHVSPPDNDGETVPG